MPEVIRTEGGEIRVGRGRCEDAFPPIAPVPVVPVLALSGGEDKSGILRAATVETPLSEIGGDRCKEPDRPRLAGLGLLHFSQSEGTLDEDRALADVSPGECRASPGRKPAYARTETSGRRRAVLSEGVRNGWSRPSSARSAAPFASDADSAS